MQLNELKSLILATMHLSKAALLGDPQGPQPRQVDLYATKDRRHVAHYVVGSWGGLAYYQILEIIFNAAGMTPVSTAARDLSRYDRIGLEVAHQPSAHEVIEATDLLFAALRRFGTPEATITQLLTTKT